MEALGIVFDKDPAWPELADKPVLDGKFIAVASLSNATVEGNAVAAVRVELADGTTVIAQTTMRMFLLAARGFAARHSDDDEGWEPGRWWRVVAPDGSLWLETSDEFEARDRMRPGDTLERLRVRTEYDWKDAS